jgi:hypothetical protein
VFGLVSHVASCVVELLVSRPVVLESSPGPGRVGCPIRANDRAQALTQRQKRVNGGNATVAARARRASASTIGLCGTRTLLVDALADRRAIQQYPAPPRPLRPRREAGVTSNCVASDEMQQSTSRRRRHAQIARHCRSARPLARDDRSGTNASATTAFALSTAIPTMQVSCRRVARPS